MHVMYVGYWYDDDLRSVDELLARCPTIHAFPTALAVSGAEVTVFQRFRYSTVVQRNGVTFRFLADGCRPHLRWQVPATFHDAIAESCRRAREVVIHVNSLTFPLQICALRRRVSCAAIVAQHHAEQPWRGVKRKLQAFGLRSVDAFLFASAAVSEEWISAGAIGRGRPIYEVMESPPSVVRRQRLHLRREMAPLLLWVGRLTRNKDPLTVLAAFEQVLQDAPAARLEMVFQGGELFQAVKKRITCSAKLRNRVTLVGEVPHRELHHYYERAHFFVIGSHREGSGYALSEAMAYGVVPVVPRIPAFIRMTDGAGQLWNPGNVSDCTNALIRAVVMPLEPQRRAALHSYQQYLSAEAIGAIATAAYRKTFDRKFQP